MHVNTNWKLTPPPSFFRNKSNCFYLFCICASFSDQCVNYQEITQGEVAGTFWKTLEHLLHIYIYKCQCFLYFTKMWFSGPFHIGSFWCNQAKIILYLNCYIWREDWKFQFFFSDLRASLPAIWLFKARST